MIPKIVLKIKPDLKQWVDTANGILLRITEPMGE